MANIALYQLVSCEDLVLLLSALVSVIINVLFFLCSHVACYCLCLSLCTVYENARFLQYIGKVGTDIIIQQLVNQVHMHKSFANQGFPSRRNCTVLYQTTSYLTMKSKPHLNHCKKKIAC